MIDRVVEAKGLSRVLVDGVNLYLLDRYAHGRVYRMKLGKLDGRRDADLTGGMLLLVDCNN